MSASTIQKLKKIVTASGGCNCRTKATDVIEPKPKPKSSKSDDRKSSTGPSSSGSSSDRRRGGEDCTSTTFSLASPHLCHTKLSTAAGACQKIQDSFAIVKNSENPYLDFRQSMLQMIFEKEIYSRDDLQQLLDCFLQLNSPHHHEVIVQAFTEIWNGGVAAADGGDAAVVFT